MVKYIPLLILCASCTAANVSDDSICQTSTLGTIPGSPVAIDQSLETPFLDYSTVYDKLNDISNNINVNVNQITFTGNQDISWITHLTVYISGGNPNQEEKVLGTYNYDGATGNTINVNVSMDSQTLSLYVVDPFVLTFEIQGTPTAQNTTMTTTACLGLNGSFDKSL